MKMIWLHYCDGSAELVEHEGDTYNKLIDSGWSESRAEAKKLAESEAITELPEYDEQYFDSMDDEELVAKAKELGITRAGTMKRETILKKIKGE